MNLVTGATGIVGSHVLYHLMLDGKPVLAARRKSSDTKELRKLFNFYSGSDVIFESIQWLELDLTNSATLEEIPENITVVYHCAGLVSFLTKDREALNQINEKGTATLVNACIARNIKLCHVSSVAAIHNLDYHLPLNENVFWKKSGKESDYAKSKYNGEREVWRGIEEGLRAVIVNPGLVLAPGFFTNSSMRMFERAAQGNKYYTDGWLAIVGANDVALAMINLIDKKKFSSRYILVENNYTYKDLLNAFAGALHMKAPNKNVGPVALKFVAFFEKISTVFSGRSAQLTAAVRRSAFNRQHFDASKIKNELGFKFTKLDDLAQEAGRAYHRQHSNNKTSN